MMFWYKVAGLILFLSLAFVPSLVGMMAGSGFVVGQILPPWTPPAWVFPIAWTILYSMIGLAGWRVWFNHGEDGNITRGYVFYVVQLILNAAWTIVFWTLNSPLGALAVIAVLIIMIWCNYKDFYKLDKFSGYLLIPYLLWVIFASTINLGVVFLN